MFFLYNYYSDKPFVRIVLPYIAGILLFKFITYNLSILTLIIICVLLIALLIINFILKNYLGKELWWGFGLNIFLVLLGYFLASIVYPKYSEIYHLKEKGLVCGIVTKKTEIKDKFVKAELEIKAIRTSNKWIKSDGKTLVFFDKDSESIKLNTGDWLLLNSKFNEPKNLMNPNEFDYKQYLAFHLISSNAFVRANEWVKIAESKSNFFVVRYAEKTRDFLLSIIKKMNLPDDVFAVTSATILGYHNEIDAELKQAYSSAGAIHILAVSGFQVGVVYLILHFIFSLFAKRKFIRWIFLLISLAILWFYAFITGLSPSVLRATAMFSFIIIANLFNRNTNIYNTISASAFMLLVINPLMLFDIGFQLSYAAVFGIVYLQPKLKSLWYSKNKIIDAVWSLFCVTLAAQIITTPLSLYYFHQFPLYFLLSGLILVPLVSVIIYVAVFLISFSWIPIIFDYLSIILKYLVSFMNKLVFTIEDLPLSVLDGIYLNITIMIFLYAILILLTQYFVDKKISYLRYSLIFVFIILVILIFREYKIVNQRKIIVYNIPGRSVINIIDGKDNILFVDEKLKNKELKLTKGNWIELGLKKEKTLLFQNVGSQLFLTNLITVENPNVWFYKNFYKFYNFKILVINDNTFYNLPENTEKIDVDLIILQSKAKINLENLVNKVKAKYIVFDSSCPKNKVKIWKNQLKYSLVKTHDVSTDGAWVIDI